MDSAKSGEEKKKTEIKIKKGTGLETCPFLELDIISWPQPSKSSGLCHNPGAT